MITLTQAIIYLSYNIFIVIMFGWSLNSISESWYRLEGWKKILFTLFCFSLGGLMIFQENGTAVFPFFFLSGSGLCFTGAAMAFKDKPDSIVHSIGAYTCIFSGFLGLFFQEQEYIPFLLFLLLALLASRMKNKTYWIEQAAFITLMLGLVLKHQIWQK